MFMEKSFPETQNMTKFLLFTFFWFLVILHGFALISLTQNHAKSWEIR